MNLIKILTSLSVLLWISTSHASVVTCGSTQRTATFDSATSCITGLQNPKVADINANFSSTTGWLNEGELTSDGSHLFLSASLTSGSWGSSSIAGNWLIDSNFWNIYDQAVISMHVGNGGGDPDYFSWNVVNKQTMGTWSYELLEGQGGGLSNLKLWGADIANTTETLSSASVPEPTTPVLLGLGLIGLIMLKTSRKKVLPGA